MTQLEIVLGAIGPTKSSFNDICRALGPDRPERGDKRGWCDLFDTIRKAENDGFVEISYGLIGSIDGAVLTEAGMIELKRLEDGGVHIHTEYNPHAGWCATDDNYDGAPDSNSPIGYGDTERSAIVDLKERLGVS